MVHQLIEECNKSKPNRTIWRFAGAFCRKYVSTVEYLARVLEYLARVLVYLSWCRVWVLARGLVRTRWNMICRGWGDVIREGVDHLK